MLLYYITPAKAASCLFWAITGACPGPLFAQIGTGATVIVVTLFSAIAGTWVYGYSRDKLPH